MQDEWAESIRRVKAIHRAQNRKAAQSVDQKSRFLFPLAFLLFNACYWIYYIYVA